MPQTSTVLFLLWSDDRSSPDVSALELAEISSATPFAMCLPVSTKRRID